MAWTGNAVVDTNEQLALVAGVARRRLSQTCVITTKSAFSGPAGVFDNIKLRTKGVPRSEEAF